MKQTPKSCSCQQCKRGRSTKTGNWLVRYETRKLRAAWRAQRLQEDPIVSPAPIGNYFD